MGRTSSAVPADLHRYSRVGLDMDSALWHQASGLERVAERFESTCSEYRVPIRQHVDGMRRLYGWSFDLDFYAKRVAEGFERADQATALGMRSPQSVAVADGPLAEHARLLLLRLNLSRGTADYRQPITLIRRLRFMLWWRSLRPWWRAPIAFASVLFSGAMWPAQMVVWTGAATWVEPLWPPRATQGKWSVSSMVDGAAERVLKPIQEGLVGLSFADLWGNHVAPFSWKVLSAVVSAAEYASWLFKLAGQAMSEVAQGLGAVSSIGDAVLQGRDLYEWAIRATGNEDLYWAWRYYQSLYPGSDPSFDDIQQVSEYALAETAKVRGLRDLGDGVTAMFVPGFIRKLFPMDWRGPESDHDFQEWLARRYRTSESRSSDASGIATGHVSGVGLDAEGSVPEQQSAEPVETGFGRIMRGSAATASNPRTPEQPSFEPIEESAGNKAVRNALPGKMKEMVDEWLGRHLDLDGQHGSQCVDLVRKLRPDLPGGKGYAKDYLSMAVGLNPNGGPLPNPGAVLVWGASAGASGQKAGPSGHVAIVESVNPDGTVNIVEQNWPTGEPVRRRTSVELSEGMGFIP